MKADNPDLDVKAAPPTQGDPPLGVVVPPPAHTCGCNVTPSASAASALSAMAVLVCSSSDGELVLRDVAEDGAGQQEMDRSSPEQRDRASITSARDCYDRSMSAVHRRAPGPATLQDPVAMPERQLLLSAATFVREKTAAGVPAESSRRTAVR